SNKLDYKKLKLFEIIKKILLINYELRLLNTIRYYPIFYILLLKLILRGLYIENYIIIKLN
ncbi:hypothetical protein CABS01_09687, partial [Colletotrichum abscissum]|uniref:uncharacterized protein n=1 Tax=Colletotrichum abscissum TaxID=1671311 RepID=UPI0027D57A3D